MPVLLRGLWNFSVDESNHAGLADAAPAAGARDRYPGMSRELQHVLVVGNRDFDSVGTHRQNLAEPSDAVFAWVLGHEIQCESILWCWQRSREGQVLQVSAWVHLTIFLPIPATAVREYCGVMEEVVVQETLIAEELANSRTSA